MNPGITSKYFSGTNTFFARLAESILSWRWLLLLMVFIMTIFAFIWALLADFFLAPAMMLLFKPLGAERQLSSRVVE